MKNNSFARRITTGALVAVVLASLAGLLACGPPPMRVMYQQTQNGTAGGKCKVVSGANTGKTGTYNADGDCAGAWGISECKNQDGTSSGKCQDAKRSIVAEWVLDNGDRVLVVDGYYKQPDGSTVHGVTTLPVAAELSPQTTAYPVDVLDLRELQNSSDPLDKLIADSVIASVAGKSAQQK